MEQEFYTPQDLSTKLNISLKTIVKHTQLHRVPGQVKIFGRWRYRIVDVEKRLLTGNFFLPAKKSI